MLAKSISGAAAAAAPAYIEDTFSTYLYTGTGSTQTITNGIDLSGKGGLVWIKSRSAAEDHYLTDTVRGGTANLRSNATNASAFDGTITFNNNGFSASGSGGFGNSGATFASWTFRKQAKFFDVVTYTGNGANRTIAHNLGSVPGCIIVKRTDTTADWQVYHRSLANTEYIVLNTTAAKATGTTRWNSTTPTSTEFSLGTDTTVNASGGTYVAYLFAHDAGGFGLTGTDNVISCGVYSGSAEVNLGYEPQWLLIKSSSTAGTDWYLFDNMRGMFNVSSQGTRYLNPNLSSAETVGGTIRITPTGFIDEFLGYSNTIYIAIRRGPMKVPTSGTSVFAPVAYTGNDSTTRQIMSGFTPDMVIRNFTGSSSSGQNHKIMDRLRGASSSSSANLTSNEINAEDNSNAQCDMSSVMNGILSGANLSFNSIPDTYVTHFFRRAPGFFDVVCDTGTGSAHTITHNLSAVPELMIRKKRSAADAWIVYANNDNTDYLVLNTTAATVDNNTMWNDTSPTSSVFTVGTNDDVNGSGATFVTYLFASVAGVSKVGSYTGTGTTKQIDCAFTGGARFVLIKRIDSTGDWYVWDTARGIVAGNDPYLLLNSTAAEVTSTDYIDTYSAGFEISSTAPADINANGGTFIFLAIA